MKPSPMQIVKGKFGSKAALVEAIRNFESEDLWINRVNPDKGLEHVSNAKLLRLFTILSAVKEKFGSRTGIIDAIIEAEKRTKDVGYRVRLEKFPVPRLYDMHDRIERRLKKANRNNNGTSAGGADKHGDGAGE